MDLVFKCPHCEQELEVDAGGAGTTLQCPSCSNTITVPSPPAGGPATATASAHSPSALQDRHYSVPVHEAAVAERLITKPNRPLEVVAKDGDKSMRIRTFKRSDCQEVGRDRFDEKVSQFLQQVGQANIVSINTINYSTMDIATQKEVEDFGVVVVFKG
jgi:ribosomal protein S27E